MANRKKALHTPDERFSNLPDYPFTPHYVDIDVAGYQPVRMHYVDTGPHLAPVVLMLHGEPSWSFAYRNVIAPVAAAGFRVIAPDHIGFGKSDKLCERTDYSYASFVDWMIQFITQLDLDRITLVCQDWGGPIGLQALARLPARFAAVIAANTLLPNCEPSPRGVADWPGAIIANWVATSKAVADLPVADIIAAVSVNKPAPAVLAAYNAPFPDPSYKAAVLEFPSLIPVQENMPGVQENREVWSVLEHWQKPFVTAFSDGDPTTKAWETVFLQRVPGANGHEISNAGHFLQEEQPAALAKVVLATLAVNSTKN